VSWAAVRIPLRVTTLALSRTKYGASGSLIIDLNRNGSKVAVRRSLIGRTAAFCPLVITLENQRVHHGHTLGIDDDWIEIDRIDVIAMIGGKLDQPDYHLKPEQGDGVVGG
jgi:hypothetical protein